MAVLPLLVPGLAIAARRPHINWAGDRALTELAVREAVRFHQLVGMGGRFGWRHPGPLWIQALAPLYELTGHAPWALSVGAIALHIVCALIVVGVAGRAGGRNAAALAAAGVVAYTAFTGLAYWTNLWAGYAFTWPLLALVFVAALAMRDAKARWALPAAFLVGTLLVQTDVSMALPVVFIGALAIGVRARRYGVRSLWHVGYAFTVLAWVAPIVQELTSTPGNFTLLWRYGTSGSGGYPLHTAVAAVGAALSVVPLGARWVLQPGVQDHLGAWWEIAWVLAFAAGLAVVARVKRAAFSGDLALVTVAATAAAVVAVSRVDGPINFYLLTWMTVLPVAGLVAIGVAIPARWSAAVAVVVSVGLVVTHGTDQDWARDDSRAVQAETAAVTEAMPAGGLVRVHVVTSDTWPIAAGVALQLERRGDQIEVDPDWVFLFGDAFRPTAAGRDARRLPDVELWFAREHERPAVTVEDQLVDLGAAQGVEVFGRADTVPRA